MNVLAVVPFVDDSEESLREEPIVTVGIRVLVDGQPLADVEGGYAFSIAGLLESCTMPGEYFIVTCSCGYAGDRGIEHGVRVSVDDDSIGWDVPEPPPKRSYRFDRSAYERAVTVGLQQARSAFASAVATYPQFEVICIPTPEEAHYRAG